MADQVSTTEASVIKFKMRPLSFSQGDWTRPLSRTLNTVKFHCPCCNKIVESAVCWVPLGTDRSMTINDVEKLHADMTDVRAWCETCVGILYTN